MSLAEWKARLAAEVCVCGHRRDEHGQDGCSVDRQSYGRTFPCLCTQFVWGART